MLPLISVVIPCFNAEKWIGATLKSVFQQDWPNLDVIVVDDGSTDNSVAVVKSQFPEVTLVIQKNAGVAAARNNGIKRAKGELIAFVDADDIWLANKLKKQWEILAANPDVKMTYTAWHVWVCDDPEPDQALVAKLQTSADGEQKWAGPSGWIYPELLEDCKVWTSTVLARRSLLDEIGLFDQTLRIGEDYDLWLRASRVTKIVKVPVPLALYRMHPGSITKGAPSENYQAKVILRALASWGYQSPDGRVANSKIIRRALARTWSAYAGAHLMNGLSRNAISGALQAIRYSPLSTKNWTLLAKSLLPVRIRRNSRS